MRPATLTLFAIRVAVETADGPLGDDRLAVQNIAAFAASERVERKACNRRCEYVGDQGEKAWIRFLISTLRSAMSV